MRLQSMNHVGAVLNLWQLQNKITFWKKYRFVWGFDNNRSKFANEIISMAWVCQVNYDLQQANGRHLNVGFD